MSKTSLQALIVDDEPLSRRILFEKLSQVDGVEVVGEAENGAGALRQIEELSPDLLFLDIQMPVMDGFEVIRRLRGPLPSIIFVTAYSEHAIQAFEVGAVDYLLKPIREDRLYTALNRARDATRHSRQRAAQIAVTLDAAAPRNPGYPSRIVVRRGPDYYLLEPDEVFAFQADGEVVWAYAEKQKYCATQNLRTLEQRLPDHRFQRIHRSVLLNISKIHRVSSLSSRRWLLTLTNGLKFIVSRRQAPLIDDILHS